VALNADDAKRIENFSQFLDRLRAIKYCSTNRFGPLRLWTTANASLSFDFPYMVAWVEEQES
jgi:hypothetical protein